MDENATFTTLLTVCEDFEPSRPKACQFRDIPPNAPVLLLAGADEDEILEPQLVRGID
ncbi:hypothetical protein ACX6XY_13725 [Streptomyces sp. O3]